MFSGKQENLFGLFRTRKKNLGIFCCSIFSGGTLTSVESFRTTSNYFLQTLTLATPAVVWVRLTDPNGSSGRHAGQVIGGRGVAEISQRSFSGLSAMFSTY